MRKKKNMKINNLIYEQIEETFVHKALVNKSCLKLSKYLHKTGRDDLAIELCRRAVIHDNSKLDDNELGPFAKLDHEKNSLKDPNINLDDKTKNIIEVHWHKNRHHPEYFPDINDMEEIDLLEMCCDWHARSIQYKTNLLEFVKIRQENRFHFPDEKYERILKYCKVLIDENP